MAYKQIADNEPREPRRRRSRQRETGQHSWEAKRWPHPTSPRMARTPIDQRRRRPKAQSAPSGICTMVFRITISLLRVV